MKIIFNVRNCGLGNNGGSLTIVKSANALVDLGNDVCIVDSMRNMHTWNILRAQHLIVNNNTQLPSADAIIATGYKTVPSTVSSPGRCGIKAHYIRGWELWQGNEGWIVKNILSAPTIKIVNSICLKEKLKSYGHKSIIIRPGNDFDDYFPMNIRNSKKIVLGGLYHTKHLTKRSDWVIKTAKILKGKYPNLRLHMFGTNKKVNEPIIDEYLCQPSIKEKNKFFNKIDIFLSPTTLEGLHIVPQEAMLTECTVVTTSASMSGTQDYIIDGKTGIVSENDLKPFVKTVNYLVKNKEKRLELGKKGREKIFKLGNRQQNMQNLTDFFMEKIK